MRSQILILILLSGTSSLAGQTRYPIHYDKPHTLRINSEIEIDSDSLYDVDFLNSNNQVIKSIHKVAADDHNSKNGFTIYEAISYHFYSDALETHSITVDITAKMLFKTVYEFQNGKETGWKSYSVKPKVSKDSFQTLIAKDVFLNNREMFPTANLTLESRMVKRFEDDNLVYKCYFERYGNLKTALPAREQFFKYNEKGQIIEHISNPKSVAGGTAFMRQTFEYNDKNQLAKREWYENSKHQCTDDFEYTDSSIIKRQKFYNIYGKGDPTKFSTMNTIYRLDRDGLYYSDNSFRTRFRICNDLD
jgi:hypothetical protein